MAVLVVRLVQVAVEALALFLSQVPASSLLPELAVAPAVVVSRAKRLVLLVARRAHQAVQVLLVAVVVCGEQAM